MLEVLDDGACFWRSISESAFALGDSPLSFIEVHKQVMQVISDAGTDGVSRCGTETKLHYLGVFALNKDPLKYFEICEVVLSAAALFCRRQVILSRIVEGREVVQTFVWFALGFFF